MGKLYSQPELPLDRRASVARGDFDFLMPFQKNLLRTDEVSEIIGRSRQFVHELLQEGRLEAHYDSVYSVASGDEPRKGPRKSPRITRRSVILYLAETANYDAGYLVIRIETLLPKLNQAALDRLIASATKHRNQIQ